MGPLRIRRPDGTSAGVGNLFSRLAESETLNPDLDHSAYRLLGAIILDCVRHKSAHSYATDDDLGSMSGGMKGRWARHWLRQLERLGIVVTERDRTLTGAPRRITPLCSYRPARSASNRRDRAGDPDASNRRERAGDPAPSDRPDGAPEPTGRRVGAVPYSKREGEKKKDSPDKPSTSSAVTLKLSPPTSTPKIEDARPADADPSAEPDRILTAEEWTAGLKALVGYNPAVAANRAAQEEARTREKLRGIAAHGKAPGSSAKTPPGLSETSPVKKDCTEQPTKESRPVPHSEHKID